MEPPPAVVFVESGSMSARKKTVIEILRESPGFISGQVISDRLGISRNAVHKHVNSLRGRGFRISGVSRRGYKLEEEPRTLSMPIVAKLCESCRLGRAFRHHDSIGSTNEEAKRLAAAGAPEGTVVVTECQTAGRGRHGRQWTSPSGKGLLFSVVLRPPIAMANAHLLTFVVATAVAESIEAHVRIPVHLKWPNDLIVNGRKAGGILLEVTGEQDEVEWIVAGIGINVNTDYSELPVALRRTATSLKTACDRTVDRSVLLARILLTLERVYATALTDGFDEAIGDFRERDFLLHRMVSVQTREGAVAGEAAGIDDRGALLLSLPDRHVRRFHAGDVTLHQLP
jgi:BirA family transcriptional regulator, biotin operon repressor / biotin---[acetyl-CoA-carboxylase] ligase